MTLQSRFSTSCFQCKKWFIVLFVMATTAISFSFISSRDISAPRPVVFFTQRLTKEKIDNHLLVENAAYYVFQNFVKNDNAAREKYDLLVYVYDANGQILNAGGQKILERRESEQKYRTNSDVNLSVYTLKRADLEAVLNQHSNYTHLTFRPQQSLYSNEYVDYTIFPNDVVLPATFSVDSSGNNKYRNYKGLILNKDFLYLNPSPPKRPE